MAVCSENVGSSGYRRPSAAGGDDRPPRPASSRCLTRSRKLGRAFHRRRRAARPRAGCCSRERLCGAPVRKRSCHCRQDRSRSMAIPTPCSASCRPSSICPLVTIHSPGTAHPQPVAGVSCPWCSQRRSACRSNRRLQLFRPGAPEAGRFPRRKPAPKSMLSSTPSRLDSRPRTWPPSLPRLTPFQQVLVGNESHTAC